MVKRGKVQELLKERASFIQQATFVGHGDADTPVVVDMTSTVPVYHPAVITVGGGPATVSGPGGQFSLAWDGRVDDGVFYAIVESDIKEHGYFKGDRDYREGDKAVSDNAKVFDEMFGKDKTGFTRPESGVVDVMPTVIGPGGQVRVKSLWEMADDLVDPRSEFEKDSAYWVQLLRFLYSIDGNDPEGLFGLLYGLRCEGSIGLEPNPKGGVKVFGRDERVWGRARAEIMGNKTWAVNLNTVLGQVVV